jgi:hypothetical protein
MWADASFGPKLLAILATISLVMAAMGLFGVLACLATQRRHITR